MEKIVISDDDNSVNSNDIDNNQDGGQNEGDNSDGKGAKDKISIKSDDIAIPNSQTSLKSTKNVGENSSLTSPSTSIKPNNWKSTNPFVNYIQDCRTKRSLAVQPNQTNFFQFVGTQWRSMPSKQKQSYVNGAAMIKKWKLMNMQMARTGQKRKRIRGVMSMKKSDSMKSRKQSKKKKPKKPKRPEKKKVKRQRQRQRLIKSGSESGSASDNESSDNESIMSDEIIL